MSKSTRSYATRAWGRCFLADGRVASAVDLTTRCFLPLVIFAVCSSVMAPQARAIFCATSNSGMPNNWSQEEDDSATQTPVETLAERQARLAKQYQQLEEKLFQIYQIENGQNQSRSELIKSAYQLSQDRRIRGQLDEIASQLAEKKLKSAVEEQRAVLAQLQQLLVLLQNEDEDAKLKEEQDRIKAYLKEVERLLRGQRGLRGQAEGGVDLEQLAEPQSRAAERAGDLAKKIADDENAANPSSSSPGEESESTPGGDSNNSPSEAEPSDGNESGDEPNESNPNSEEQSETPGENSKPPEDGSPQSGQPQSGQPQSGQPQSGQPSQGQSPDSPQSPQSQQAQNPVQQRIEAAQEKMKQAQKKLENAEQQGSIEEMQKAEAELAKAKEELEEILRQLREKEIERTLAALESRIQSLRDEEKELLEKTQRLDEIDPAQRIGQFRIQAGKLSSAQASLANQADSILLMLQDEGSSIAFPTTLEQVRDDMEQVAEWLRDQKVGEMTQFIEQDIIDSLDDLIEALVEAQEQMQDPDAQQQQQQGQPSAPGEQPLVNQIQELKLIRGLQIKINRRHDRYTSQLNDPDDPIGYTTDQELQDALNRLSDRQNDLRQITRDIVLGKNDG